LQSLDTAGQEAARGFYLSGWGGASSNSFDRIGRGSIVLPRYCLSVFGGFQPDRIKSYVQSTQGGNSKNDGLLQRFQLLVWPDPYQFESVVDRAPDKVAIDAFNQSMFQLAKMVKAPISGVNRGRHGETLLHFEPEAQIRFNQWLTNLEKFLAKAAIDSARLSHFAKYRSLVPALALLFHLLDGHTGPVSSECLDNAILFSKYLRSHANRVYASIGGVDHECTRTLAQRLLNKDLEDGFTCRTVVLKGWSGLTKVTAQSALDALVEFGWLTEVEKRGNGRPTFFYKINEGISAELLEVSMVL
jgi:putative DNA primase/helicase